MKTKLTLLATLPQNHRVDKQGRLRRILRFSWQIGNLIENGCSILSSAFSAALHGQCLQLRSWLFFLESPLRRNCAHCKFKRVVSTPRGNFRSFCKRVVLILRKGRFNSEGSFDAIKGSKWLFLESHDSS